MTEFRQVVVAFALSVLAHVSLFAALALMPVAAPVPVKPEAEEKQPLEVMIEAAPAEVVDAVPAQADAIQTQFDPVNLKKADKAPEHPTEIASHDSQATPQKVAKQMEPAPSPPSDFSATLEAAAVPAPSPQPAAEEVGIDAQGYYGKAFGTAIQARWELYRKHLPVGEVQIKCVIDAQGRVSDVKVLLNTAAAVNAQIAIRAVKEAKIPPIPPERLAQIPSGRMEITYSFFSYPDQ